VARGTRRCQGPGAGSHAGLFLRRDLFFKKNAKAARGAPLQPFFRGQFCRRGKTAGRRGPAGAERKATASRGGTREQRRHTPRRFFGGRREQAGTALGAGFGRPARSGGGGPVSGGARPRGGGERKKKKLQTRGRSGDAPGRDKKKKKQSWRRLHGQGDITIRASVVGGADGRGPRCRPS